MRNTVLVFAGLITALLILFRIGRYSLFSGDLRTEILLAVTALAFLGIGLLLRRQQLKATPVTEEISNADADPGQLKALAITAREQEVLSLVAEGLSNREIGKRLFLSESTVKTHVSNLLTKLEAKRRTQAVERARRLKIL
ncbi:MAG: response regulator transcription factor [Lewinella sp.]